VLRVLNAGARGAARILQKPAPSVRIEEASDRGVEYVVRYWICTEDLSPQKGRHLICSSILAHLDAAGIGLARPQRDLFLGPMREPALDPANDRPTLIRRNPLFRSLTDSEVATLSDSIQAREFKAGDIVFEQNDAGDSMYCVVEGLLIALAPVEGQDSPVRVGQIAAGEFFGEMSLLTGAPRSATISVAADTLVFEVTKSDLGPLISQRPEVALHIAGVVAEREARTLEEFDRISQEAQAAEVNNRSEQLLKRMTDFFRGFGGGRGS